MARSDGTTSSSRRWAALACAAVLALSNPFLHKPVSDVCDWLRARWGFLAYDRTALIAIPVISVAVACWLVIRRGVPARRAVSVPAVIVLAAVTFAAHRWLFVANIELIHFPQFALLGLCLLAAGFGGVQAYLLTAVLGVLDETYQHLVIYAGVPGTYFDINDIVLNAIGGAWAVVLFGRSLQGAVDPDVPVAPRRTARRTLIVLFSAAVLAAALWFDPPTLPLLRPTDSGRIYYRVLSTSEGVAACLMLLALVGAATTRRDGRVRNASAPARVGTTVASVLATLFITGCATARAQSVVAPVPSVPAVSASTAATPFILTFWCGPPLAEFNDARAAEIVAAGFNVVGPPCEGGWDPAGNVRALDVAARHGLKVWVRDERYSERAISQPDWQRHLADASALYRDHPAFGGYFVMDEPLPEQIPDLAIVTRQLREVDPDAFVYINLLADYVGFAQKEYEDYVERFVADVKPSILSYDYYPFLVEGKDRPSFFGNLDVIREAARRHDIPFMLIIQSMPHAVYRDLTEAELSWQAMHALANGARGISYFAYWTPVHVPYADQMKFRNGLIEHGTPTRLYREAASLNARIRGIVEQLEGYRLTEVHSASERRQQQIDPLAGPMNEDVTVGWFTHPSAAHALLFVNGNYRRSTAVPLRSLVSSGMHEQCDSNTHKWTPAPATLPLAGGDGLVVRWQPEPPFLMPTSCAR